MGVVAANTDERWAMKNVGRLSGALETHSDTIETMANITTAYIEQDEFR